MKKLIICICLLLLCVTNGYCQGFSFTIKAKADYHNTPVVIPVSLPKYITTPRIAFIAGEGYGQTTKPGLTTEHIKPSSPELVRWDLHFIL